MPTDQQRLDLVEQIITKNVLSSTQEHLKPKLAPLIDVPYMAVNLEIMENTFNFIQNGAIPSPPTPSSYTSVVALMRAHMVPVYPESWVVLPKDLNDLINKLSNLNAPRTLQQWVSQKRSLAPSASSLVEIESEGSSRDVQVVLGLAEETGTTPLTEPQSLSTTAQSEKSASSLTVPAAETGKTSSKKARSTDKSNKSAKRMERVLLERGDSSAKSSTTSPSEQHLLDVPIARTLSRLAAASLKAKVLAAGGRLVEEWDIKIYDRNGLLAGFPQGPIPHSSELLYTANDILIALHVLCDEQGLRELFLYKKPEKDADHMCTAVTWNSSADIVAGEYFISHHQAPTIALSSMQSRLADFEFGSRQLRWLDDEEKETSDMIMKLRDGTPKKHVRELQDSFCAATGHIGDYQESPFETAHVIPQRQCKLLSTGLYRFFDPLRFEFEGTPNLLHTTSDERRLHVPNHPDNLLLVRGDWHDAFDKLLVYFSPFASLKVFQAKHARGEERFQAPEADKVTGRQMFLVGQGGFEDQVRLSIGALYQMQACLLKYNFREREFQPSTFPAHLFETSHQTNLPSRVPTPFTPMPTSTSDLSGDSSIELARGAVTPLSNTRARSIDMSLIGSVNSARVSHPVFSPKLEPIGFFDLESINSPSPLTSSNLEAFNDDSPLPAMLASAFNRVWLSDSSPPLERPTLCWVRMLLPPSFGQEDVDEVIRWRVTLGDLNTKAMLFIGHYPDSDDSNSEDSADEADGHEEIDSARRLDRIARWREHVEGTVCSNGGE